MPCPTPASASPTFLIPINNHRAAAAPNGLTRADLLQLIGPTRTSLASIQRALDRLRSDHAARIRYDGRTRRWHLDAPPALPLTAPVPDDVLAALVALAILEPHADGGLLERLTKLVGDLDQRVRERSAAAELPPQRALTFTLTLGTRVDPQILRAVFHACRRKVLRIRYQSPSRKRTGPAKWQAIEPWALRIHDGAIYLRAWSSGSKGPATFRLAHITELRELDAQPAKRHTPPTDPWRDESPAFGIDVDPSDTAAIRMRGDVARWVARIIWHPADSNDLARGRRGTRAHAPVPQLSRVSATKCNGSSLASRICRTDPPMAESDTFACETHDAQTSARARTHLLPVRARVIRMH